MTAPLQSSVRDSDALPARLEDSWDEPMLSEAILQLAQNELQGSWFSVAGRREAVLLISGNRFTVRFADGDIYMGAFELHPTRPPKVMAMHIDEGPRHKGKTVFCIYELDGHTLRWCAGSPGQAERLTAFPAEDDAKYLYLRFSREHSV
jgi:uncharacterized protein (TIGR03067 family)